MAAIAETGPSVTFAVERFGWVGDDRLEIAGRWFGLRGHRFLRLTLDVEVHDGHRRLLALLEHKPWAADDGEEWVAAFGWEGQPLELFTAELAVGPDLAVELPPPQGGHPVAPPDPAASRSPEARAAGRPRGELEFELVAAREAAEDLSSELERLRGAHANRVEELQRRLGAEREAAAHLRDELAAARAAVAASELESANRLEQLEGERDAAVAASAAAVAEAKRIETERDAALRARAAAEQERDAAVHARDSARRERNAWMSRARQAAERRTSPSKPAPTPRAEPVEPATPAPRAAPERPPEPPQPPVTLPALARAVRDRPSPPPEETPIARRAQPRAARERPRGEPAQERAPAAGVRRPGVRTVRIGFDDPQPPTEPRSPVFALQPAVLRSQPGRGGVPLWALRVGAALVLVLAVLVVALLIL
jgi:hypothetical protein